MNGPTYGSCRVDSMESLGIGSRGLKDSAARLDTCFVAQSLEVAKGSRMVGGMDYVRSCVFSVGASDFMA